MTVRIGEEKNHFSRLEQVVITTRDELIEILKTSPVPETLTMLEEQGGSAEDLANAILEASASIPRSANTLARDSDTNVSKSNDPVLAALVEARDRKDQADRDIRILLAYARELSRPRPYRLIDLAAAAGMSISGVRTAYTHQHTETALRILRAAGDGQSTPCTNERTPENAR